MALNGLFCADVPLRTTHSLFVCPSFFLFVGLFIWPGWVGGNIGRYPSLFVGGYHCSL